MPILYSLIKAARRKLHWGAQRHFNHTEYVIDKDKNRSDLMRLCNLSWLLGGSVVSSLAQFLASFLVDTLKLGTDNLAVREKYL